MKLFFAPGACSLSPHIILREADADFSLEKVDLVTKTVSDGGDFFAINPKGQVPVLVLEDGAILTEGVAIVQFLADRNPEAGLMPAFATIERARVQETLNFISSEFHKAFGPLFNPATSPEAARAAKDNIASKFDVLEKQLSDGRAWLAGDTFSPADAYGFTVSRWATMKGMALSKWPMVQNWLEKVGSRDAVRKALAAEG